MPLNENKIIDSGHGLYFEGGFNPGHLISKKLVLGFYAGWAWKDKLWSTSFNSDFVNDYRVSINTETHTSSIDSAVINASPDIFAETKGRSLSLPGCETRSFNNYSFYYGAILRLPYKYAPAIKVYTGFISSYHHGKGDMITKGKDYNIIQLKRAMYGCELIIFRGLQSISKNPAFPKYPASKNTGALSIYYELSDFYNSSLHFYDGTERASIPLKRVVSSSFLQKYKNEVAWGIKVSFCIL